MKTMNQKIILFLLLTVLLLPLTLSNFHALANNYPALNQKELDIVNHVNGTNIYNYDLELEKIALNHTISNYSLRSAGSLGATKAAEWISEKFESFGLQTVMEPFDFPCWNLLEKPTIVIDEDGNENTTDDQTIINSFQSEHYSWPTPKQGVFAELTLLPMPQASSETAFSRARYNATAWNAINTTDKILLIGREVRWNSALQLVFQNKLRAQRPLAIIYAFWYTWDSQNPLTFGSAGGLPISDSGSFYWDLEIPIGSVNYTDGLLIRSLAEKNASARFTINADVKNGPHYNVVAKLPGSANPDKTIIISGHYDTVMCSGFCDNGAGISAVIELARVFSEAAAEGTYRPENTLVFIAFTSEELGLVGSIHYVQQHRTEMKNIVAVINLDSIGSDTLEVSQTSAINGLDLDELLLKSASDLNVTARMVEAGGSDQETFRFPTDFAAFYQLTWHEDAGMSNVTAVQASAALYSFPLFYSDLGATGNHGWIHTPYDESTTLGWVTTGKLEDHTRVAALSIMRVLSYVYSPFIREVAIVAVISLVLASVLMYIERSQVGSFLKHLKARGLGVVYFVDYKGFLYVVVLTVLLISLFSIVSMRLGKMEITVGGFPRTISSFDYGFPFKMFSTFNPSSAQETAWLQEYEAYPIQVYWDALITNLLFSLLLGFTITYAILKIRYIRQLST